MKISILNVEKSTPPGKKYVVAEVSYKNLTFGKVESKKIFSFGAQEQAFKAIGDAQVGDVFDIEVKKNDAGYNDWIKATQEAPGTVAEGVSTSRPSQAGASLPIARSTYETPEERAKKQVFIVKQSSISSAIALLSVGAKAPPKVEDVIGVAQQLTDFVFQEKKQTLLDLVQTPNDLEDVPL